MRSAVWVTGHWVTEHKPVIVGIKRAESPSSPTELTLVPGTGKYFSIFVFLFLNLKIACVITKLNLLSFLGLIFFLIGGNFFFYFLFLYCLMLSPIVLYYLSYCLSYFRVFFLEICYLDFSGGKGGIHVWYPFVKSEKKFIFFISFCW